MDIYIRFWKTLMCIRRGNSFPFYEDVQSNLESFVTYRNYDRNYRGELHSFMEVR